MNIVLIWDIDGTLLTTNGRGFPSMLRAVQDVLGFTKLKGNYANTHGLTDLDVIKNLSTRNGKEPSRQILSEILNLYERYIEIEFNLNPPLILPSIVDTLDALRAENKYEISIGTGNSINGAKIKLQTSNLLSFFQGGSFYCSNIDNPRRLDVFRGAKKDIGENKIGIVIGDTPTDIECAFAAGFKCIAVESGVFSSSELQKFKPNALLKRDWVPQDLLLAIVDIKERIGF